MSIFYFLLLSSFFNEAHDQNDNCTNEIAVPVYFNQHVISYKNKSGQFSVSQIPKIVDYDFVESKDHVEFEELLSHFEKSLDISNPLRDDSLNAIAKIVAVKHCAIQHQVVSKQIEAQKYLAHMRFREMIKRFHHDMSALLRLVRTADEDVKTKIFETHSGCMKLVRTSKCKKIESELEKCLNALYIERDNTFSFNDLFVQVAKESEKKLISNQYDTLRLFCFEQILRCALKHDWDSLYNFPMHVLLNEHIVRAVSGNDALFLFNSKQCFINEFIRNDDELSRIQDVLESLVIQLSIVPFRVTSFQLYNNECYLYGKPKINTPTDYFNYLKNQRKNNWICKHLQCLYKQANSFGNGSWYTEDAAFDERLKPIIEEVFKEFGMVDNDLCEPGLMA